MNDFGARVRAALAERGLSLRAAARAIHYDPAFLSRVLSGRQRPSPQLAQALDDLLDAEGALAGLAATLTPDDRDRITHGIANPTRIDAATVASLADVLAAQRRLDDSLPAVAMITATEAQWRTVKQLARNARGPHAGALHEVAAEWVQFVGWLHASARNDAAALHYLTAAEEHADDLCHGPLAAQAANFKGYLARQQGRPRAIVRWFLAAYHTPGATAAQRMGDASQAAQGLALLGQRDDARRLLDEALDLAGDAAAEAPPGTAYWLTPTYQHLNLGLAHLALEDYGAAADHIRVGLDGLPPDQQGAEWTQEYRQALVEARAAR